MNLGWPAFALSPERAKICWPAQLCRTPHVHGIYVNQIIAHHLHGVSQFHCLENNVVMVVKSWQKHVHATEQRCFKYDKSLANLVPRLTSLRQNQLHEAFFPNHRMAYIAMAPPSWQMLSLQSLKRYCNRRFTHRKA